ncbi:uncharacterized protein YgiM (DUF1202 family) [Alkalibacillus filiformis]|uniref:Uncharacterized protein YgiM (DUF1202 family) n=1 Tax=Alkalibacillus filiformis TaxID=200990 RepID=A0ABU0DX45_9BACI|nr:SH3 domain-containing protein [Alkalibacillus filiformis]MDQ0353010.1 uncharacterized protein YgiM (DUF1202 family) [Alkalibacillus filiformis]
MKRYFYSFALLIASTITIALIVLPTSQTNDSSYISSANPLIEQSILTKHGIELQSSQNPSEEETLQEEPSYTKEPQDGDYMSEINLNLREGPSTDFETKATLSPYEKVSAKAQTSLNDQMWYLIEFEEQELWASSAYLTTYEKPQQTKDNEQNNSEREQAEEQSDNNETSDNEEANQSTEVQYDPNTIYFHDQAVSYKNGGQANGQQIIDSGPFASTWGGAETFSGTDGMNTHFIGHNPGVFNNIWTANEFVITDSDGNAFRYTVDDVYQVDDHAIGIDDGENYWSRITGTGGGERVTFQACLTEDDTINWIIEASSQGQIN